MNKASKQVDGFIRKSKPWQEALQKLRAIILDCELTEEVKWRAPCYTYENSNVVFIGPLKDCCVLSFIKGALLKDKSSLLIKPGQNTQSARMIRFTSLDEIVKLEPVLKAYIHEAIEVEKAGLKVDFKAKHELVHPEEFQSILDKNPALKAAYDALTPGRQRHYNMHFTSAKQSKTRTARVEKCIPQILAGKGLNDE